MNIKMLKTTASACAILFLAACQTMTAEEINARNSRAGQIDAAMERASQRAGTSGSLASLERSYKRNPQDEIAAASYAAALRKSDQLERAVAVLSPFAKDPKSSAASKSEFSAIQLAKGNFKSAERYAQDAIVQDDQFAKAYHNLGISLDAQEEHSKAERAYRKALDLWQGDPTSIMNNLALNLTAQNHLDEASEILHKAKALSPEKVEIERNLRIVTALQQSHGSPAPKPPLKPEEL